MDIETIAASSVKTVFGRSHVLNCEIHEKDRTPLTDGHIDVHGDSPSSNENIEGRLAAQVKGKGVESLDPDLSSFQLKVSHLKNFLKFRTVLFLAVAVDVAGNTRIYYSLLTPFRVNELLKGKEQQKTLSTCYSSAFGHGGGRSNRSPGSYI